MKTQNIPIMTLLSTLLLGVFLSFTGCEKVDVPKGTPKCIKKKIKNDSGCLQSVYEYNYVGEKVYVFAINTSDCIDAGNVLYNENCKLLCETHYGAWGGKTLLIAIIFKANAQTKN